MAIYGYARISTNKQSIERQIRNIKKYSEDAVIIEEAYTGTTTDRKEWNKLYSKAKSGDIIVFDSVSRMSRNAEEGFLAYQSLFDRGVELVFIKEPHINSSVYRGALESAIPMTGTTVDYILDGVNKFLMELAKEQIVIAFQQAAKEVSDLHQRTREGLITAKLNGKRIGMEEGRKLKTKKGEKVKEDILKYSKDFGGSLNDNEVMSLIGVARNTYYKYKGELKRGE